MKFVSTLSLLDKKDFIIGLRDYYNSKKDPYNKDHLWNCFTIYFNFLKATSDPRLTYVNKIQWEAYEMAVKQPDVLWHRTRRGGKTIGMSILEIFFAIIEFGVYDGAGSHRAPHKDQLRQFKKWLYVNPFFIKDRERNDKEIDILMSEPLEISCVTKASSSGRGVSFLYEDEMGTISNNELIADYMRNTRAFLLEGDVDEKRHMHASTGRKNTIFEDDYIYLYNKQLEDHAKYVHIMPWTDCEWISQDYIDKEKKQNFNTQWWIDEQYGCKWVNAKGSFFDNENYIILGENPKEYPLTYFEDNNIKPNLGGLDWNGLQTGHILVLGYWDYENSRIYIINEVRLDRIQQVNKWIRNHLKISVEVEGKPGRDGFNAGYSQALQELGTPCILQNWKRVNKNQRLTILQNNIVIIHPRCKWCVKNWKEAVFKSGIMLDKRGDQHGLDGALHLVHTKKRDIDVYKKKLDATKFINEYSKRFKTNAIFNY